MLSHHQFGSSGLGLEEFQVICIEVEKIYGATSGTRTHDLPLTMGMLYQLSYGGTDFLVFYKFADYSIFLENSRGSQMNFIIYDFYQSFFHEIREYVLIESRRT